jgi:DNA repair exonuclease SbcCD nuclease subunit
MVRVLIIGDPHFKTDNCEETQALHDEVAKLITNTSFDAVVVLGDTLHRHEKIDMSPLKRSIEFLRMIKTLSPRLYLIIGNHDRPNNNVFLTDEHPFNSLKEWSETYVVDKVLVSEIDNEYFVFVPYVPTGRLEEALKTANLEYPLKVTGVFSHQEYHGCKITKLKEKSDSKEEKSNGDVWPLDAPINFSGHIHDYEEVQNNLIYVGTPFQHSNSMLGTNTVSIAEFDKGMLSKHLRVQLKIPKKITISLTLEEAYKWEDRDKYFAYVKEGGSLYVKVFGDSVSLKTLPKIEPFKTFDSIGCLKLVDTEQKKIDVRKVVVNKPFRTQLIAAIGELPEDIFEYACDVFK